MGALCSSQHSRRSRRSSEFGASAVEFALVLPPLLMIALGACVLGMAIFDRSVVSHAAREAARWASVHGSQSGSPASTSQVQTYVEGKAQGLTPLTVTTTWTPANKNPGSVVRVDVSYNFSMTVPLLPTQSFVLSSSAENIVAR